MTTYHWKDIELGRPFVPLQADVDPEDTENWLKMRRPVTASSAATKAGASADSSAQTEADWDINHPGEKKPDPEKYMEEGHDREDPVAKMGAKVLFPYPELLPSGYRGDGFNKAYMYFHPDMPDVISATPDRLVGGHPESRIFAEIKYSRHLLRERPKVDHLFQTEMQMECVGSDYIFLIYGHLDGNCAVFLIQKCPELWLWMHKRHQRYMYWIKKRMVPPKNEIPFLGYAIKAKWCKGITEDWVKKDFPDQWMKEDFFPPQPKWQLVGYFTDGSEQTKRYPDLVERYSPRGPVDAVIFRRAIGSIWERIGVECESTHIEGFRTNREMAVHSFCDELRIKKELDKARGIERSQEVELIERLWADSHELFEGTARQDSAEYTIDLEPMLPMARDFLDYSGIKPQSVHRMNSTDGAYFARRFAQYVRDKFPLLYRYIEETDDQMWGQILLGVDLF